MSKMDIVEKEYADKKAPAFRVGDTLKVHVRVKEGDKTRTQLFEGVCIRIKGKGVRGSFTVLKETTAIRSKRSSRFIRRTWKRSP